MKALIKYIIAIAGTLGLLLAAETQELPDLRKAFPTQKLEIAHREGAIEWYLFETNLEFAVLKKSLLEFLGKEWSLVDHDKDKETKMRAEVENQESVKLLDMAVIKNNVHPSITVSLHLTERLSNDGTKSRYANILRSDSKKEGARKITLSKLTRSAAESGNAWAQCELGVAYFIGRGVEKSPGEAIKWWRKAAEQGNALAQFSLGGCYHLAHGVPQDYAAAVRLYRQAAEQGLPSAHYALATCYDAGEGVEANPGDAAKHYLIAAKGNVVAAQFNLGVSYYLGQGVEKNPAEAYAWISLSSRQGGLGQRELEDLEKRLPPEISTTGKKRAEELAKDIATSLTTTKKATGENPQKK